MKSLWIVAGLTAIGLAGLAAWLVIERRRMLALRWPRTQGFYQMQGRIKRYLRAHGWTVHPGGSAGFDRWIIKKARSGDCVIRSYRAAPDTMWRAVQDFTQRYKFAPLWQPTRLIITADPVQPEIVKLAHSKGVNLMHYKRLAQVARLQPASTEALVADLARIIGVDDTPLSPTKDEEAAQKTAQKAKHAALVRQHIEAGKAHLQARDPQAAAAAFRAAVDNAPDNIGAIVNLASALGQTGETAAAMAALRNGLDLAPRSPLLHIQIGHLFTQLADWPGAENAYRAAIETGANANAVHAGLATALAQQGRTADAVAVLQARIGAGDAPHWLHTQLGQLLLRNPPQPPAAEAAFRAALASEPNNPNAAAGLAIALSQQGQADEALAVVRTALVAHPANVTLLLRLGHLLEEQNRPAAAEHAFAAVLATTPDNKTAQTAHARCRKPAQARALLTRLAANPQDPEAIASLAALLDIEPTALTLPPPPASGAPDAEFFASLGRALAQQGQRDAAVICVLAGLDAFPETATLLTQLGQLRQRVR